MTEAERFVLMVMDAIDGELVEAMCIGRETWDVFDTDAQARAKLIEGLPLIKEFDVRKITPEPNHCAVQCYIWTPTRVLFVHEYDSSFSINSVPRHPIPCNPQFNGLSEWIMKSEPKGRGY